MQAKLFGNGALDLDSASSILRFKESPDLQLLQQIFLANQAFTYSWTFGIRLLDKPPNIIGEIVSSTASVVGMERPESLIELTYRSNPLKRDGLIVNVKRSRSIYGTDAEFSCTSRLSFESVTSMTR